MNRPSVLEDSGDVPSIALSSDGRLLYAHVGGRSVLARLDDGKTVDLDEPEPACGFAFADELWLVTRAGGLVARRLSAAGQPLGAPLALSQAGPFVGRASAIGGMSAILHGATSWCLTSEERGLAAVELGRDLAFAAPMTRDVWLGADEGRLFVQRNDGTTTLRAPELADGRVFDAQPIFEGTGAMVAVAAGDGHHLLAFDLRGGPARHRLRIEGCRALRVVQRRRHVLALSGRGVVTVIDLRFGRSLKQWCPGYAIADIAVDAAGERLVVMRADGQLLITAYNELFRTDQGAPMNDPEGMPRATEPREGCSVVAAAARADRAAAKAPTGPQVPPHTSPSTGAASPPPARSARSALATVELQALAPRIVRDTMHGPELHRWLASAQALVAGWCRRAIAVAWDTGRIGLPDGTLPFQLEVAALLDHSSGRAPLEREQAERQVEELTRGWRNRRSRTRGRLSPLDALVFEFGLSPLAAELLLIASAPYLFGELARAYAIVANDPARPLCDELLAGQMLAASHAEQARIAAELVDSAPLVRHGLLRLGAGSRPFKELVVCEIVVQRLAGVCLDPQPTRDRILDGLQVPDELLAAIVDALSRPCDRLRLVLRGRAGSGRRTLLEALAARANRRVAVIDVLAHAASDDPAEALLAGLRDAHLRGWMPCVTNLEYMANEDSRLRTRARAVLRDSAGPIAFRATSEARLPLDPGHLVFDLPTLDEEHRANAWSSALVRNRLPAELACPLAARYRLTPGAIERVTVRAAATESRDLAGIAEAARREQATRIGEIATLVERLPSWSDIVLPHDLMDSLREFMGRIEHRRKVYEEWGFDRRLTTLRGLTALFQGGPGTGKSMVAGAIAHELGYQLYRVDLGRVLSKWIGETERNLGMLFDAAEEGDLVLLFDEADALFTKRTEVRSSVDRYANVEVNYLLQRLDSFEGIAILTTNLGSSVDAAFKRRLTMRLTFPFPDESMREQLWRSHLPAQLPVEGTLDLSTLARVYELSGGFIRNSAVRAAFLAAKEGCSLKQRHLEWAIKQEYRDGGKLLEKGVLE